MLRTHQYDAALPNVMGHHQYRPFYELLQQWMIAKGSNPQSAEDRSAFLASLGLQNIVTESDFAKLFPTPAAAERAIATEYDGTSLPTKATPGEHFLHVMAAQLPGSLLDPDSKQIVSRLEFIHCGRKQAGPGKEVVNISKAQAHTVREAICVPHAKAMLPGIAQGNGDHPAAETDAADEFEPVREALYRFSKQRHADTEWADVVAGLRQQYQHPDEWKELVSGIIAVTELSEDIITRWAAHDLSEVKHNESGQYLALLRHFSCMMQKELGKASGLGRGTIQRLESGAIHSIPKHLGVLSEGLGLSEKESQHLLLLALPALDPAWLDAQPVEDQPLLLLIACRKCKSMTQEELANASGLGLMTIRNLESGRNHTIGEHLEELSNGLGLTTSQKKQFLLRVFPVPDPKWLDTQPALAYAWVDAHPIEDRPRLLLAAHRQCKDMSQRELGKAPGLNPSLIDNLETGYNQSIARHMDNLCNGLGLSEPEKHQFLLRTLPALDSAWLKAQLADKQAGLLLAAYRERTGKSQTSLGKTTKISRAVITRLESGERHTFGKHLEKLSAKLGLSDEEKRYLGEKAEFSKKAWMAQKTMAKVDSTKMGAVGLAKDVMADMSVDVESVRGR